MGYKHKKLIQVNHINVNQISETHSWLEIISSKIYVLRFLPKNFEGMIEGEHRTKLKVQHMLNVTGPVTGQPRKLDFEKLPDLGQVGCSFHHYTTNT